MPYPKQGKRKVPAPHQGQSWGTFRRMGLKTSLPQIIRERFVERHSPPFLPLRDPAGKDGAGHNGYFACCPVCLFQMVMSLRWGVEKGRIESCQRSCNGRHGRKHLHQHRLKGKETTARSPNNKPTVFPPSTGSRLKLQDS